jgi:hypothetical protein
VLSQGGDPPRVWDATLEKPGCAFTRSFGDAVAKEVGVTAEPEILTWDLSPKDRFAGTDPATYVFIVDIDVFTCRSDCFRWSV